jgi:sugar lactone lactonase YvrE
MGSKGIFTVALCFFVSGVASGQQQVPPAGAQRSLQASEDPREAAVLATCKNPPTQVRSPAAGPVAAPSSGPRDYSVTEIPGVIAAGQKWKLIWQTMGNNGDGIVGTSDGGLLIAQNDNSQVAKLDKDGKASVAYADTNTGGALSMNTKGALYIAERGFHPSIVELAPAHRILADHYQGDPLDCIGTLLNDLTADSKSGAYFTMGGLYYASPNGQITKYGDNIRANGIILSPDETTLYVTNGSILAAFDVQPDSSLTNQREFGKLEAGGNGDGSTIDSAGRIYVSGSGSGIQVISPEGKYLGVIPTPRGVVSVAFSGPDKKLLYILARGAKDAQGNEVANAVQVYSIPMIAQGYKNRAK